MFYILDYIAAIILYHAAGTASRHKGGMGLFTFLTFLALAIPGFAVGVRRMHDIDKSGWWIMISFIPILGAFVFLYLAVQDGTPGTNRFGPNPKQ